MSDRTIQANDDVPFRAREREMPASSSAPLADREVPLRSDGASAALHAWLDGEAAAPRQADGRLTAEAELWSRIATETKARREIRTPAHVAAQIMAALPDTRPAKVADVALERPLVAPVAAPAADTGLHLSYGAAAAAAGGLIAFGALVGRLMR